MLIAPAFATEDIYDFNVVGGSNTLQLNTSYNGTYVNSINGTLSVLGIDPNPYYQELSIQSSAAVNNATFTITIPRNSNMATDFSDLRFYNSNQSPVDFYVFISNSTHFEVSIKSNLSTGQNLFYMTFGYLQLNNISNSSVYLYFEENTYYNNSSTKIIYSGSYTNLDIIVKPTTNTSEYALFRLNLNDQSRPYFYYLPNEVTFFESTEQRVTLTTTNLNNTLTYVNFSTVGSLKRVDLSWGAWGNTSISGNISTTYSGLRMQPYSSATLNVSKLRIYNQTPVSLSLGPVFSSAGITENVSLQYPNGLFNSLSFNSDSSGVLNFKINYEPHSVMITENNTSFAYGNVFLEFDNHPSNQTTQYEIALDQNFFSIIESGFSSGQITSNLTNNSYYWRIQQPDSNWSETHSFTVEPPPLVPGSLTFKIVNELNNTNVSATVKLTNTTTTLQKTGTNITFNGTEVGVGNYSVQITATNYTTRFYDVVSPGNYTLYALPNANASVVYFSLIDNTNTFQFDSTKLEIIKQTPNGSLVVHHSYFDATGFSIATLNNFDNYILKVVSDSGHEKILGNYIQAGQNTVQLVISDIILKENNSSLYGGFTYNLTKSGSAIKFDWINPNNALIEPLLFQIYKNDDIVMNISSDAPFGSINYQDNVDGEMKLDPTATYRIVLTAKTVNGTIRVNEFYKVGGESVSIDFEKIPLALRIVISLILLILVASLFNITNAKFSAIVVTLVAGFLTLIGFLPILPSVLIWLLFVAIVAYKTNNR